MFCANCGNQLPEGANVCPNCGTKVDKEINFQDVTNYAGQKVQQVSDNIQGQVQNIRHKQEEEKASRTVRDIRDMFVNPDEQQRAVIGGGYLSNMLQTGMLGKGFGVLTDRRLYYRGKCFYKVGGRYMKTDEDCIIDLQDITSSGFTYTRYLWILFLAIINLICCLNFVFKALDLEDFVFAILGLPFMILEIILIVAYLYFKISVYEVTFAGGSLSIKASAYGINEAKAFDKALHQAKDEHLARMR